MSNKKIKIGQKPSSKKEATVDGDAWVKQAKDPEKVEAMKRLTVDIPESLHRQLKADCAMRGSKIADEIREMLTKRYIQPL